MVALLVVDNGPMKEDAWQRLQLARKRLTKATADLHRHEKEDEPAYTAWMFATCPTLLSDIRDLVTQCQSKAALIANVEALAWRQGKPAAVIWQMHKGQLPSVEGLEDEEEEDEDEDDDWPTEEETEEAEQVDELVNDLLREQGIDPDSPEAEMMRDIGRGLHREGQPEPDAQAKDIYRRLVQQLHPDRGGEWTAQREALWHEVQRAWDARDADWLSRLEAELEIAAETLGVQSALGRLYAALAEIEAARRDTERKLRHYRKTPAWRFTLKPREPEEAATLASSLRSEREQLRAQLAHFEAILARWEKPVGIARAKQRSNGRRSSSRTTQLNLW